MTIFIFGGLKAADAPVFFLLLVLRFEKEEEERELTRVVVVRTPGVAVVFLGCAINTLTPLAKADAEIEIDAPLPEENKAVEVVEEEETGRCRFMVGILNCPLVEEIEESVFVLSPKSALAPCSIAA